MTTPETILERYEQLQILKEDIKDIRDTIKEECMSTADYETLHNEKAEIVGKMRAIENEVKDRSGLGNRLKELNLEKRDLEDVLTAETMLIMSEGMKEIPQGYDRILVPHIKVTFKSKQMEMKF